MTIDKEKRVINTTFVVTEVNWQETTKMIIDTGCRRSVAGTKWHNRMQASLARNGLQAVQKNVNEKFRFGNDAEVEALVVWTYPLCINGTLGEIEIAQVPVKDCPGLLSQEAARDLGIVINFNEMTIDIVNANVFGRSMEVGASGHMMIDILDLECNALLPILRCPKFLLVPEQMIDDLEAARERLRMEGELEFRAGDLQGESARGEGLVADADEERDGLASMGLGSRNGESS